MIIPSFAKDDNKAVLSSLESQGNINIPGNLNNLRINLPFFMGVTKKDYVDIGGYDEDFTGLGYDDDDIVNRLQLNGCKYINCPAETIHLWHERKWSGPLNTLPENLKQLIYLNKNLYESRKAIIKRNINKEWGLLKRQDFSERYPEQIDITMILTSCKRYALLEKSLLTFFECCLDADFIKEIIIIDDGSAADDVKKAIELLNRINKPFVFLHKSSHKKGHAQSLNYYFDLIKTDYILQMEDDWEFTVKDNFISKALFVMTEHPDIKQVAYRKGGNLAKNQKITKTKNGIDFIRYDYTESSVDDLNRPAWTGWNLNPSLQKWKDIKTLGLFEENIKGFEINFSHRFLKAGFKLAYFPIDFCNHLGDNNSAYNLNNTNK